MQNQKIIVPKKRIISLDALRGIAAILIVILHVRFIPNLYITDNLSPIVEKFNYGVTLFFILSAFSLFLNYRDRIIDNNSIKDFYINRLARIYPLFIFMLIFYIIVRRFEGPPTTSHELIVNIFYIFNIFPEFHLGMVWASWALGVLFLFYLAVPILIIFVRNVKSAIILTFILLLLSRSSLAVFSDVSHYPQTYAYMNFIFQSPVFGFGILFYFLYESRKNISNWFKYSISSIGLASIFIIYFMYIYINAIQGYVIIDFIKSIAFYVWAFTLSFLVYSQCDYCIPLLNNPISRFYGKISYSLYIMHPFVIYKLKNIYSYIYSISSDSDVAFAICCLITIIIVTPLAFIANKLIENPGSRLVKNIYKKVNNQKI